MLVELIPVSGVMKVTLFESILFKGEVSMEAMRVVEPTSVRELEKLLRVSTMIELIPLTLEVIWVNLLFGKVSMEAAKAL